MSTRSISLSLTALCLAALAACSPARTGLLGNTLTSNTMPPISITANAPLQPFAGGRLWISMASTQLQSSSTSAMAYAVFSTPETSGPVTVHGHALIIKLEDTRSWRFQPDSKPLGSLAYSAGRMHGGYGWTAQILAQPSAGDWFSELWAVNGRAVPEIWIAKRYSAIMDDGNKAVFEYREPGTVCSKDELSFSLLAEFPGECLVAFSRRADRAFSVAPERGSFDGDPTAPQLLPTLPDSMPDTLKLIGEVTEAGNDGDGSRD